MPLASTLLRLLLMLSLLLNGANAAMAGEYVLHAAQERDAAAAPPCHRMPAGSALDAPASAVHGVSGAHSDAPPGEADCRMKDCARACAQLPLMGVAALPALHGPWRALAPSTAIDANRPAPALPRVVRPPIA